MTQLLFAPRVIAANDPDGNVLAIFARMPEAVWLRQKDEISPWWPGNCGQIGQMGVDVPIEAVWFEQPERPSGGSSRLGVLGVTRDQYGSPLGGVTVKLFRTLDDTKQDQIVSDPLGNFLLTSPFSDDHYLVFYKTGAPDVTGSSVNTIIPV